VLHPEIEKVMQKLGISSLTLPQERAIPKILEGKHCLIIAPTGLGKTEAALLPVFHLFLEERKRREMKGINILYITPLRALNRDMLRRTMEWGKALNIKIGVRHGDTTKYERRRQMLHPPNMLITTPETLQILLSGRRLREGLKNVGWVIVDEIHELAGGERGAQMAVALERLRRIAGDFQRIGLSATMGNPEEVARFLNLEGAEIVDAMGEKAMEIEVEVPEVKEEDYGIAEKMELGVESASLLRRVKEVIEKHEATLFFVNTRDAAEILAARLKEMEADIEIHHGSLSREARIEAEERFKKGEVKALICTSSLELGIDVGQADFVLQYNSPRQVTRIVQRVGRSGHRVGKVSRGMIVAINPEEYAEAKVIAEKAIKGEIEKIRIRENPVAVMANQIIAMAVEYGEVKESFVYDVLKRTYPFRNLDMELFRKVVEQLRNSGIIWAENGIIKRRRKSTFYFIDNISMIPDEKSYDVLDISSGKKIGKLDEGFVSKYCEVGSRFIIKGRAWEVVKKDEIIHVSPVVRTYIVPDWAGEEIPVPFEVAREVGKLRRKVAEGKIKDRIMEEEIREQKEKGFIVPSDRIITIEGKGNVVYINTHFGTRVNETLSKIIGSLLAQRIGESIAMENDAYRIRFIVPHSIDKKIVKDILLSIKPEGIEDLLRIILKRSAFIKWDAVKVARKFGILEKDASYENFSMDRIMNVFRNTPFMEEVVDRVIWEKMDVENTMKAVRMIRDGEIEIKLQSLSPISLEGEKARKEFLRPFGLDASLLKAIKKRIEETAITMICMACGYEIKTRVERAPLTCPKCSSKMLAVTKGSIKEKSREWLMKNASLVAAYGKRAIMAMAAHGVGPDTASRILSMEKKGDDFLKEILKAEITYARTRRFWD